MSKNPSVVVTEAIKSINNFDFAKYPRNYLVLGAPRTGKSRLLYNLQQRIPRSTEAQGQRIGGFRIGDLRRLNLEMRQRFDTCNWRENQKLAVMREQAEKTSRETWNYEEFFKGKWAKRAEGAILMDGR